MLRPPGGIWRHRAFLTLWAGQTASLFGSRVGGFAFDLTAFITLHASVEQVALLNGCIVLPPVIAGSWVGVWADRVRRRPLLVAADLGRAIILLSVPLAAVFHRLSMPQLYAVAGASSILTVLFDVSFRSFVPALLGPEALGEANSVLQATAATAEAGGWSLSGIMVQLLSAPLVVLADSVSFLASALSLLLLPRDDSPVHRSEHSRWWPEVREGLRVVRENRTLRVLTIAAMGMEVAGNAIGTVIMLFFIRDLHLPPSLLGPLTAIGGLSSVLGALLAHGFIRRIGLKSTLIASLYFNNLGLLAVVLAAGPLPIVSILVALEQLTDAGRAIYEIHALTLWQRNVPAWGAGRVNGTFQTLQSVSMVLGLAVGGLLGQTVGLRGALLLALVANLTIPLVFTHLPVDAEGEYALL